jgi:hypothetical protein
VDEFIVSTRNMTERLCPEAQNTFRNDLELLGLRRRRGHDLRRTFITLAQVGGAHRDLLETITHGPRGGDIINESLTKTCDPSGIRTRVQALKGLCPGPG